MPELPEVETVRRVMERLVVGRRFAAVDVIEARLRQRVDVARLRRLATGRAITSVRRRGKYLLFDLGLDAILLVHLGMTGKLSVASSKADRGPHDHLCLRFADGEELRFNDTRRFGLVDALPRAKESSDARLARLGVEPLEPAFDGAYLYGLTRRSKRPVKTLLMDAACVVGVGNIYASEALYSARIWPLRRADRLDSAACERLCGAVRQTLLAAIDHGGSTIRDFAGPGGEPGRYAAQLRVYGREGLPCAQCGAAIERTVLSGRSTFHCPGCQPARLRTGRR